MCKAFGAFHHEGQKPSCKACGFIVHEVMGTQAPPLLMCMHSVGQRRDCFLSQQINLSRWQLNLSSPRPQAVLPHLRR
jgi:hypothetical protein